MGDKVNAPRVPLGHPNRQIAARQRRHLVRVGDNHLWGCIRKNPERRSAVTSALEMTRLDADDVGHRRGVAHGHHWPIEGIATVGHAVGGCVNRKRAGLDLHVVDLVREVRRESWPHLPITVRELHSGTSSISK